MSLSSLNTWYKKLTQFNGDTAPKDTNAYFFWNAVSELALANNTYFNLEAADAGWTGISITQITLENLLSRNMVLAG